MRTIREEMSMGSTVRVTALRADPYGFLAAELDAFSYPPSPSNDIDAEPSSLTWDEEMVRETHGQITSRAWRALSGRML